MKTQYEPGDFPHIHPEEARPICAEDANALLPGLVEAQINEKLPEIKKVWLLELRSSLKQEVLEELVKDATKVWGFVGEYGNSWSSYPPGTFIQENHSHTARLVCIKEIVK